MRIPTICRGFQKYEVLGVKIVKKINNNVAVGIDGNHREMIVCGKGIGFGLMPYELNDLSRIDRTYYDIDAKYIGLLNEIPEDIFNLVSRLVEIVKSKIDVQLNPNLVFILADHVHFSITRYKKGMNLALPYSYELEYEYPQFTQIARWFVKNVNKKMNVHLENGEITSIVMHFVNATENNGQTCPQSADKTENIIRRVTRIVEEYFGMAIDRSSFNYFRFKNHLKYFVQRKEKNEEFKDSNTELYREMRNLYPGTNECVSRIDDYLGEVFHERCSQDELLYLMVHVNRLYTKEDFDGRNTNAGEK